MKNLPRGLTWVSDRGCFRLRFTSKITKPGRIYAERLPPKTKRRDAEEHLANLRKADREGRLLWPNEKKREEERRKSWVFREFVLKHYLPYCELHNQPSTVRRKKIELKTLAPWFWDMELKYITAGEVASFAVNRKGEGVSDRTVNIGIVTIQHILSVAHELGILPARPPKFKKLPERDRRQVRWLTEEQAELVLEHAATKGTPWYQLVLFLLHTGARYSEARSLRWEDIDWEKEVVAFKAENTKSGKTRKIPLLPEVIDALRSLPQRESWVFMQYQHSRRKDDEGKKWTRIPDYSKSGRKKFPWDPEDLRVHPHMFRHTFAAWRLRTGVSIAKVQAWMGHSSIKLTVDTYGHLAPEDHAEEIGRAPRPGQQRLRVVGSKK